LSSIDAFQTQKLVTIICSAKNGPMALSRDKHFAALSNKRQAEFLMEELKAAGIEYGVDYVRLRLGEWKKGRKAK